MYSKEFQESLKAVEAARKDNIAYEPTRMTAKEKDDLLAAYHPDYKKSEFSTLKIGPNKGEEVPHELAVRVDEIKNKKEAVYIRATIIVDKDSHKGIVIGKNGSKIKEIGKRARKTLEKYFNKNMFLELFVSVKEDWINNPRILKELGYK